MGDSLGGGSERVFVPNNLFGFNTAYASKADAESLVKVLGANNLSVGKQNLINILSGAQNNTVIGIGEGSNITTSSNNVILGDQALSSQVTGGSDAGKNTAVGVGALDSAVGSYNVGLGYRAGQNVTTGSKNVFIGGTDQTSSGSNIDNCICIGHNAGANNTESKAATSNYAILGNKNITNYVFCGDGPSPDNILTLDFPNAYQLELKVKEEGDRYMSINAGIRAAFGIAAMGTDNVYCPGIQTWIKSNSTFNFLTDYPPSDEENLGLNAIYYGLYTITPPTPNPTFIKARTGTTHTFYGPSLKLTNSSTMTLTPNTISSSSGGLTLRGGPGLTSGNPTLSLASAGQISLTCGGAAEDNKGIALTPTAAGIITIGNSTNTATITTASASNPDLLLDPRDSGRVVIGGPTATITTTSANPDLTIAPNGAGVINLNSSFVNSGASNIDTILARDTQGTAGISGTQGVTGTFGTNGVGSSCIIHANSFYNRASIAGYLFPNTPAWTMVPFFKSCSDVANLYGTGSNTLITSSVFNSIINTNIGSGTYPNPNPSTGWTTYRLNLEGIISAIMLMPNFGIIIYSAKDYATQVFDFFNDRIHPIVFTPPLVTTVKSFKVYFRTYSNTVAGNGSLLL